MKRARSIEEWTAGTVALAVKCQRIQDLETQVRNLQAKLLYTQRLAKLYDRILKDIEPPDYFKCPDCEEWCEDSDRANCENGCAPSCQDCEDRIFCSLCHGLFCSQCIRECVKTDCSYACCVNCGNKPKHHCPDK